MADTVAISGVRKFWSILLAVVPMTGNLGIGQFVADDMMNKFGWTQLVVSILILILSIVVLANTASIASDEAAVENMSSLIVRDTILFAMIGGLGVVSFVLWIVGIVLLCRR